MDDPIPALVVRLCQRGGDDALDARDLHFLRAPEAADRLLEASGRHGVRGLVLKNLLSQLSDDPTAGPLTAALRPPYALLRKQGALWDLEEERIQAVLASKSLRPVFLKGGALRHVAYSDPIERWMGDLDLLVRPSEASELLEALEGLGYASEYSAEARREMGVHHYHHGVTHPSGFIVEVHLGLTRPAAPCRLDAAKFLERARECRTSGKGMILVPSPEDMVLHLASQVEQEGCRRLSRIVDLDRVIATAPGLDWGYVRAHAYEGNLQVALALSLRLAHLLFATHAPEDWVRGRAVGRTTRAAIASLNPAAHLMSPEPAGPVAAHDLLRAWLLPTWSLRVERLRELSRRRSDPLQWVWEGMEAPDGEDLPRTGGLARVSKLLAYQLWTLAVVWSPRPGRTRTLPARAFWTHPGPQRTAETLH